VDIEKLHRVLFHILKDFRNCCDRHGLKYMLCGGTLLGAVRHKGFIPWDDDADVMMPRCDYEKLGAAIIEDYGDKYKVTDCKSHDIMNILLNGTIYDEVIDDSPDRRRSIFLDIYPIDNMPKGKHRLRAFRFYWAKHAEAFVTEYKYKSSYIKELCKTDKEVAAYFKKRWFVGFVFSIFGSCEHYNKVVQKLANYKKETGYLGIPLAIAYNREKFRSEVLTETTTAEFNGETFTIPEHYDEYLTNLYGADYMTLPPPEKREVHVAAKVDFGVYANLNEHGDFDE
jgi:lipopolysaccharide cholinephosphotransferase